MPGFAFEVEYAKSNRAACKQCKEKIDKGAVRLGFKQVALEGEAALDHVAEATKWHHAECFSKAKGIAWFKKNLCAIDQLAGTSDLKDEDRERVIEIFKVCKGEASLESPQKTDGPDSKKRPAAGAADGESSSKAAKTAADSQGLLTAEQAEKIAEVKAAISKKNAAALGAMLAKNGLAKTGRKDELVERIAENQVLGVPPSCPTCEKGKLKWSRVTGKFSCPGYFDDDSKAFKRCKGPAADAEIERVPWQELA
eukprot:gnl/TRDRNA2_/TRDRNA2_174318_c2_seq1.p1 gnl/TRDRNA2_/TRDRNA2_174318_c2~~gnl/TRDRNA2_/TRDRNA2_174318_c2_seq1.p1  ORF type:complete len:254 (-),score=81.81 gnl/TRDRNA2_/TRDRNA2_174318_c2_seq1:421-1182(-)